MMNGSCKVVLFIMIYLFPNTNNEILEYNHVDPTKIAFRKHELITQALTGGNVYVAAVVQPCGFT